MLFSVPDTDFADSVLGSRQQTIWSCGHVSPPKSIPQRRLFVGPVKRDAPPPRLDAGARVVRHQGTQALGNTVVTEEARTVDWMEPRLHQVGRIADVVQPGCGHQFIGIVNHTGGTLGLPGHALNVRPSTR